MGWLSSQAKLMKVCLTHRAKYSSEEYEIAIFNHYMDFMIQPNTFSTTTTTTNQKNDYDNSI